VDYKRLIDLHLQEWELAKEESAPNTPMGHIDAVIMVLEQILDEIIDTEEVEND